MRCQVRHWKTESLKYFSSWCWEGVCWTMFSWHQEEWWARSRWFITNVISPSYDAHAHLFFSMEGFIAWSFAPFLGGLGVVETPFKYEMQFRQVKVVCILSSSANILFVSPQSWVDVSFNVPMSTISPCRHSTNIWPPLTQWPTNDFPWVVRSFHVLHVSQHTSFLFATS